MKIKHLMYGVMGASVLLSSCNLDTKDEDNYQSIAFPCASLVVPSYGEPYAANTDYALTFYVNSGTLTVGTSNLVLGTGIVAFTTNPMEVKTTYDTFNGVLLDVSNFSGGHSSSGNTSVSDLKGFTSSIVNFLATNDPVNPLYPFTRRIPLVISYNVGNNYKVKTFMPDAIYNGTTTISSSTGQGEPFTSTDIRYRVVFAKDFKTADVIFYSAKFAAMMPNAINFVLRNLNVEFNSNGYIISGMDVIPDMLPDNAPADGGLIPAPGYPFKSFKLINAGTDLTTAQATYTVAIGPAQYFGTFAGAYVYSATNE